MKKVFFTLVCIAAMMAAGTSLKAQEVTIVLTPGWNWISHPSTDTVDFATAFGSFTPATGDVIKSRWGQAFYTNNRWMGSISQFYPGYGYMYKSNRMMPVMVTFNVQQPVPQVVVTTTDPTAITTYSATCGGMIGDEVSDAVLVRGVCWSTIQNPTITDSHTTDSYGTGNFSSFVEGLEMNTTYYVRAYALTISGVGYGEQKMFTTKNGVPTLTTSAASEIGVTWATCGGDISDDGGMEITERGICWSTTSNPTIEGDHGANGAGLGSFSVNMNGLEPNTTYYVRAYATNGYTTAYGNEVSFRTEVAQTWPNGKLPGQFSVSATHQVQFSQGNLQYIGSAATPYWRFAEHQWDYFGTTTGQNSSNQNVDRDLFGWGTSGWNNGNMYYQPYDTDQFWDSNTGFGYGPTDGTNYNYNLTGDYANADWGVYNAILNGGNASHQWRSMTSDEWNYLINTRTTTSGIRYAKAQVYGKNGVVLLPDDWDDSLYALNFTNNSQAPFDSNVIADSDWASMETNGAVFLPAAGYRSGTSVINVGSGGYYWPVSYRYNAGAYVLSFGNSGIAASNSINRYVGHSIRLVSVTLPEVSTGTVNDVSGRLAIVGGNVTEDGNADLSACGICCSTSSNPTTDDMVVLAQNTIVGEYTVTLNGLTPNTTYYARAFATNSAGTSYGDEISFTTLNIPTWTNGILPGEFSVSANQQVQFSQGNLQYIGSSATPYWQFAENQWDYLGNNGQGSTNQNVDRDLFGWGTSGYNHGANCYQPWSTSQTNSDYYAYGSYTYNLNDSTGMADWGYNAISNGGNQENQWRTLTKDEWRYVLNTRSTISGLRFARAQVFGVNGIILLPDNWDVSYYTLNSPNISNAPFTDNVIAASDWNILEQHGAVFLPVAGFRGGSSVYLGSQGSYWSVSYSGGTHGYSVYIGESGMNTQIGENRYFGFAVRLVRSIPVYSIEATPNPPEGGTVTGQGDYRTNATCTLTATPNEGYVFANWTENGTVVSTESSYTFTVTGDKTLVANFMQVPTGAIAGLFTVNSNGSKVYFSQGNLQYIGSATIPYWKFADNQWDYLGTTTGQNSSNSEVDRDLFGWGTSGYNHGALCYQPWGTNTNNSFYYAYGNYSYDLGDLTGKADWGYNPISNGGNTPNTWRTLTNDEWVYLFNTRNTDSGVRYVKAKVNNVNGLILLPDNWNTAYHSLNNVNPTGNCDFDSNIISYSDWISDFQLYGAVFLPAAGLRNGTSASSGFDGDYWSASSVDYQYAGRVGFNNGDVYLGGGNNRYYGFSVRLVRNAE